MKLLTSVISLTVLALLSSPIVGAETVVEVEEKVAEGDAVLEAAPIQLRLDARNLPIRAARGASNPVAVVLPPLSVNERNRLPSDGVNAAGVPQVGIGRELPVNALGAPETWQWQAVAGGQATHLSITSPQAQRINMQVQLAAFPVGAELRFYALTEPDKIYGVYNTAMLAEQPRDAAGNTQFWSVAVTGDTVVMEVFLPEGVTPAELALSVPRVSHLLIDPASAALQSGAQEANSTASCHFDLACASPDLRRVGRATAILTVTSAAGETSYCSGVLLNNTAKDGKPYLLTAGHCLSGAAEAASVNTYWFYENSTCGGNDAKQTLQLVDGGAALLIQNTDKDIALLALNKNPPKDALYAGWSNVPPKIDDQVIGIHHSDVLPKKVSSGYIIDYIDLSSNAFVSTKDGGYAVVGWAQGVTQPGASGSGMWYLQDKSVYLTGTLSRGPVDQDVCAAANRWAIYARFDKVFPLLKSWLNP